MKKNIGKTKCEDFAITIFVDSQASECIRKIALIFFHRKTPDRNDHIDEQVQQHHCAVHNTNKLRMWKPEMKHFADCFIKWRQVYMKLSQTSPLDTAEAVAAHQNILQQWVGM